MTLLLLLLACRPDPGAPNYPDPSAVDPGDTGEEDDFYDGPDPYVDGEARLAFGAFYEGASSETLVVDDVTRHYYIYDGTYTQSTDVIDRIEGYESDVISHAGSGYWGGGINWDAAEDLSSWTTLHVSMKASSETFASLALHIVGGGVEGIVQATDHGWVNDGTWVTLDIPLSAYTDQGTDLSSVTAPFVMIGTTGTAGDELRVDNLYYSAD